MCLPVDLLLAHWIWNWTTCPLFLIPETSDPENIGSWGPQEQCKHLVDYGLLSGRGATFRKLVYCHWFTPKWSGDSRLAPILTGFLHFVMSQMKLHQQSVIMHMTKNNSHKTPRGVLSGFSFRNSCGRDAVGRGGCKWCRVPWKGHNKDICGVRALDKLLT